MSQRPTKDEISRVMSYAASQGWKGTPEYVEAHKVAVRENGKKGGRPPLNKKPNT
jgi:hypothetical protein